MTVITLRGVGVARDDRAVLADVDLTVPSGSVTALLGASGSGKTTLLRAVAGLTRPTAGTVRFDDDDVTSVRPDRRDLAYVPQGAPLLPDRDVAGNLAFPLQVRGVDRAAALDAADGHARRFGIGRLRGRLPRSLSTGERAAAGIARGLVRPPRALLLDEPVPHLDPRTKASVLGRIGAFQQEHGTTVLLATNDVHVVEVLADRVAVIDRSTVVRVGSLGEVRAAPGTVLAADLVSPTPLRWLPAVVERADPGVPVVVATAAGTLTTWASVVRRHRGPLLVGIGQRDATLVPSGTGSLSGRVTRVATTGPRRLVHLTTGAGPLVVDVAGDGWLPAAGDTTDVEVRRAVIADGLGDVIAVVD